jgi:molybdenum cofactor cytidylyltransferase
MPAIAAIVLAAGPSTRLGQPKQLLQVDGQTLVRRAVMAAIGGGCAPVYVVIGANASAVATELADLPIVTVTNDQWLAGMGTSLSAAATALRNSGSRVDGVMVLLCDQPQLDANVVTRLKDTWLASARPMAACAYGNTIGPPCCFAASMFDDLRRLSGDQGAKRLLLAAPPGELCHVDWPAGALDIDTPQDAARLAAPERH